VTMEKLVSKYIRNAEHTFDEIGDVTDALQLDEKGAKRVFDSAKRYLEDAKYYQREGKLETSLASVAYCEGLLDALRLLGAVEFSW
jgi:FAD synthetase